MNKTVGKGTQKPIMSLGSTFDCSMCQEIFKNYVELKGHLRQFHGVTGPISSGLFTQSFPLGPDDKKLPSVKPQPKFVSPVLVRSDETKASGETAKTNNDLSVETPKNKSGQSHTSSSFKRREKTEAKVKKLSNTGFCTSLNNIFSSGVIKMEKLGLWDKSHKKKPCVNEGNASNQTLLGSDQSFVSQFKDNSINTKALNRETNIQTLNRETDTQAMNRETDTQAMNRETNTQTLNRETDTQAQIKDSNTQVEYSDTGSKIQTSGSSNIHASTPIIKTHRRSKKKCNLPECIPCSITEDCMLCQYDLNKKLK